MNNILSEDKLVAQTVLTERNIAFIEGGKEFIKSKISRPNMPQRMPVRNFNRPAHMQATIEKNEPVRLK